MKCKYDPSSLTVMCDLPESPIDSAVPSCVSTALNATVSFAGLTVLTASPTFQSPTVIVVKVHVRLLIFASRADGALGVCAAVKVAKDTKVTKDTKVREGTRGTKAPTVRYGRDLRAPGAGFSAAGTDRSPRSS